MSAQRIDEDRDGKKAAAGEVLRPDLCVIGAGEAGVSAALEAASSGASVVLVERDAFGGAHLRGGCIPSKGLVAAAARAQTMRDAAAFGLSPGDPRIDFAGLRARLAANAAELALARAPERLAACGVQVLRAQAHFLDPITLVAGEATIQAGRFVVATGGRPALPDIPGLAETPHLTSDTIFDMPDLPESLVVLGGGPLGLELAQAFCRLGCSVVVIERHALLPREDRELAACVEAGLRAEGVDIRIGARVVSVEGGKVAKRGNGVRLLLEPSTEGEPGEVVTGDRLLVATGRAPVLDGLDLDRARVRVEPTGIVVDARMRASNRRIYAIGDCAGAGGQGYRFSHAARRQSEIVVADVLHRSREAFDLRLAPRVTFTDPELAAVGEIEDEARARRKGVRVLRLPFAVNERARIEGRLDGLLKLVLAKNGRVLGCAIAGRGAGEMIALWTLVVSRGMRLAELSGLVAPNPTLSELSFDAVRAATASARARGEGGRPGLLARLRLGSRRQLLRFSLRLRALARLSG